MERHGQAASSGSKTKAPGSAGGYLLWVLAAEYSEFESGKPHRRSPATCRGACDLQESLRRLVVAKLDRLARKVAFISPLRESGMQSSLAICRGPNL